MDIEIGPETSNISLGRYAKRNDIVGFKARREQERRLALKPVKKAKIKEESTADIRGLGLVSGNPVVDSDAIEDYLDKNNKAFDAENKELERRLQKWGLRGFIDHSKSITTKKAKGTVF
jgi:hypothetical protein